MQGHLDILGNRDWNYDLKSTGERARFALHGSHQNEVTSLVDGLHATMLIRIRQ